MFMHSPLETFSYEPHVISSTGFKSLRKDLKSLHQRQERLVQHRLWIEGRHTLECALEAGWQVETLLSRDDTSPSVHHDLQMIFQKAQRLGYDLDGLANSWLACPPDALVSVCDAKSCPTLAAVVVPPVATETHEGLNPLTHGHPFMTPTAEAVSLLFQHVSGSLTQALPLSKVPLVLGLWGIQDPGNLGTLLRSAVAFGVQGVVLIGEGCVDPWGAKALRASAGMGFKLPVFHGGDLTTNAEATLMYLATQAELLGTCSVQDTTPYRMPKHACYTFDWVTRPHFLLLGCEGTGIPKGVDQHIEHWVTIPTAPQAESLNVAMAGSILMSTAYQQKIAQS
ncbi:MAG: TrmH family RNA methyltransferase [Vampirovibrionales bacterium]